MTQSSPTSLDDPPDGHTQAAFREAHRVLLARAKRRVWATRTQRVASIVFALGLWTAIALANRRTEWFNPILLPTPQQVLEAGIRLWESGDLVRDIKTSLLRVVEGFLVAMVAGLVLGGVVGWSRIIGNCVEPLIELLRPIPPLAFLPIFVMWLGLGESAKVLFIAFVAFFTIFLNTVDGVRGIDPVYFRAAQSLGARSYRLYFRVILPAAMPQILTGLRLGFGMAFFALVAAELIAADSGLGYRIQVSQTYFSVDAMLFVAAVIGVIGFLINYLLRRIETRALRWQPRRHTE